MTAATELEPLTDPVAAVAIADVSKVFGTGRASVAALDHISLDVAPGEFVCLLGASGCGKSTLLNIVAGLDKPTSGEVNVRANRTGLMFQESALFPWLTARGNVELALKLDGVGRDERRSRTDELLAMVHLGEFAKKRPHELSGGMRQRVALARALAQNAEVLLMDEPFGALDAMTRDRLHDELETVWRETGKTVIFVTHNVREGSPPRRSGGAAREPTRTGRGDLPGQHPPPPPHRFHRSGNAAATITDRLRAEVSSGN